MGGRPKQILGPRYISFSLFIVRLLYIETSYWQNQMKWIHGFQHPYDSEHVRNIYSPVPVGPVDCLDEEGQVMTEASQTKEEDQQISSTGLVINKTEQNSG